MELLKKYILRKTGAAMLVLLIGLSFHTASGKTEASYEDSNDIMISNVWVDVPLTQVFRDISAETGVIIATCPHIMDSLVSLDTGSGKTLKESLEQLVAGHGYYISKRSDKFYLISCGDPACPSTMDTVTSERLYLKYISAKHFRESLPKSMQEYVTSGERNNEVFVYGVPEITKHVMDIAGKLDIPQPQVMLEVMVVDLWEDTADELGIDWQYDGPHTSFGMEDGLCEFNGNASYASIAASNLTKLSLALRALVADKKASIRSRPRVATINGEKASIDISLDEYFTIATDLYGTSLRTELEVIKSGVMMEITPQIGDKGDITVNVLTEVSDVASRRNTSGNMGNGNLPVIRRRKADTHVRVKEGDAIVIGGLVETSEDKDNRAVPGLSSLPILGGIFKSKKDASSKKEVVIFITPKLMKDGKVDSTGYELIDEGKEQAKLIDKTTDKSKKLAQAKEAARNINEVVAMLDESKPGEAQGPREQGQMSVEDERAMLKDMINILSEEEPAAMVTEKKYKSRASLGGF